MLFHLGHNNSPPTSPERLTRQSPEDSYKNQLLSEFNVTEEAFNEYKSAHSGVGVQLCSFESIYNRLLQKCFVSHEINIDTGWKLKLLLGERLEVSELEINHFLALLILGGNVEYAREVLDGAAAAIINLEKNGKTLMYYAALNGDFEMVQFLVEKGANVEYEFEDGCGFMHLLAQSSNPAVNNIAKLQPFLLEMSKHEVDLQMVDGAGQTAFYYAINPSQTTSGTILNANVKFAAWFAINVGYVNQENDREASIVVHSAISRLLNDKERELFSETGDVLLNAATIILAVINNKPCDESLTFEQYCFQYRWVLAGFAEVYGANFYAKEIEFCQLTAENCKRASSMVFWSDFRERLMQDQTDESVSPSSLLA